MNILITGSNGFLGKILVQELSFLHNISTLSRQNADYNFDLSTDKPFLDFKYDLIIHCAGLAHIESKNENTENLFFDVNVKGTKNLLTSLELCPPDSLVFISSVAVYGRSEGVLLDENTSLDGSTPYAKSKIQAERLVENFGLFHGTNTCILRLPLVVGVSPKGNLKSLINVIKARLYFRIGSGSARKSIVAAKDVANLIPLLVSKNGIYNLTDRLHPKFNEIDSYISKHFNRKVVGIPESLLRSAAKFGDFFSYFPLNTQKLEKITETLTFCDNKAVKELGWSPNNALNFLFKK